MLSAPIVFQGAPLAGMLPAQAGEAFQASTEADNLLHTPLLQDVFSRLFGDGRSLIGKLFAFAADVFSSAALRRPRSLGGSLFDPKHSKKPYAKEIVSGQDCQLIKK